ncbi:MAG: PD-(D/E)XK nuclease family protein [Candidatus Micrarchaeota archaeon]
MGYLPVSILNAQAYCEYQIYLQYIRKIRPEPTAQMIKGRKRHEELEQEFLKEAAPLPEPVETYIPKVMRGEARPFVARELFVFSDGRGMCGKIDEAEVNPETVFVIDDKPNPYPYAGTVNQLRAYCLLFQDQFSWTKPICSLLRDRDTGKVVWKEDFASEQKQSIEGTVQHLRDLFSGKAGFTHAESSGRCRSCRFKFCCEFGGGAK